MRLSIWSKISIRKDSSS